MPKLPIYLEELLISLGNLSDFENYLRQFLGKLVHSIFFY